MENRMLRIILSLLILISCFGQKSISKRGFYSERQQAIGDLLYNIYIHELKLDFSFKTDKYSRGDKLVMNTDFKWIYGNKMKIKDDNRTYSLTDFPQDVTDINNVFAWLGSFYVDLYSKDRFIETVYVGFHNSNVKSGEIKNTSSFIDTRNLRIENLSLRNLKITELNFSFEALANYYKKAGMFNAKAGITERTESGHKTEKSKDKSRSEVTSQEKFYKKQWEKSVEKTNQEAKDAVNELGNILENIATQNNEEENESDELSYQERVRRAYENRRERIRKKYQFSDQFENPWADIPYDEKSEEEKKLSLDFELAHSQLTNPNYKYPKNVKRMYTNLKPVYYDVSDQEIQATIAYYLFKLSNEYLPLENTYDDLVNTGNTTYTEHKMEKAKEILTFAYSIMGQIVMKPGTWESRYEEVRVAKDGAGKYLDEYYEYVKEQEEKLNKNIEHRVVNLINKQKYEEAIIEADTYLMTNPRDIEILSFKSKAQLYAEKYSDAIVTSEKILKIDDDHEESLFNIASAYYNTRNWEKAASYFKNYRANYPNGTDVDEYIKTCDYASVHVKVNKLFNEYNSHHNSDKDKAKKILSDCEDILNDALSQSHLSQNSILWELLATVYQYQGNVKEHKNALDKANKYKN